MTDTKTKLMDAAASFVQVRGYHGFSFHDLADSVGIKTASIHYHFPTKADLGRQLVQRYTQQFMERLGSAEDGAPDACLARYVAVFRGALNEGKMCLCGMIGAEISGIPPVIMTDVQAFFASNRDWLARVLGRAGVGQPALHAGVLLATLEGAMMIARVSEDPASFDAIVRTTIDGLLRA